jgi:hypothetical protein
MDQLFALGHVYTGTKILKLALNIAELTVVNPHAA